jgi:hypothetical protein
VHGLCHSERARQARRVGTPEFRSREAGRVAGERRTAMKRRLLRQRDRRVAGCPRDLLRCDRRSRPAGAEPVSPLAVPPEASDASPPLATARCLVRSRRSRTRRRLAVSAKAPWVGPSAGPSAAPLRRPWSVAHYFCGAAALSRAVLSGEGRNTAQGSPRQSGL